jgi:hypothetical protein
MFLRKTETHYLVCYLNGDTPSWQRWKEKKKEDAKEATEFELTGEGVFGNQKQLPVAIVGDLCDAPPLMDLTYKNIEHYQTYSDYKSVLHKCCRPLFYSVNLDGDPVALGSDIWFKCGENGTIGFAEPAGTSIDKVEMCLENVKKEMGQLGLAMLAGKPVQGDTTATEKMLDSIQETSALQVRATQLKDALELALGFTAAYIGQDDGGSVELGANWNQLVLTAQDITSLSGLVDSGQYSLESFLWFLYKSGKLPPDVEPDEEQERIDAEMKANAGIKPVVDGINNGNTPTSAKSPAQAAAAEA